MRHPLDNFIAGWMDKNPDVYTELYVADDENSDSDGMVSIEGELNVTALVRAIAAEFGVVELPEPTAQAGAGTGEWRVDEATTVFACCGHVELEGREGWYESPAHARALAAALLAAANRAEAQQ